MSAHQQGHGSPRPGSRPTPLLLPTILVAAATFLTAPLTAQERYDIVLAGGRVMDPETGFDAVRHVGIRDGEIAAISEDPLSGEIVLDVSGLVVAPGFIDLHAHGQTNRANEFQARDGVTTALELESGVALPAAWLARRGEGAILNYGATVSHMSVRTRAMPGRSDAVQQALAMIGDDPAGALREFGSVGSAARYDPVQLEDYPALRDALASGLADGALGIGMAHQYYPGASLEEILEVFKFAADEGVTIHTHVRDMGIAAMQEVLANALATGASLHIVHVNSSSLWRIGPILDLIGGVRSRGFDVTTEAYPYTAASTGLQSALFDPGWQESLRISYGDLQWQDTGERLTAATFQQYRSEGGTVIIHMMKDEWIREALSRDFVMVASDGMPYALGAHPRSAGTFSRFLGRYVRDEGLMPLMEGLARITIMPARRLERMTDQARRKGRVQAGMDADITVFDPDSIIDTATFEDDLSFSVGVAHVLVNGEFVVRDGENVPGAAPGQALLGRKNRPMRRPNVTRALVAAATALAATAHPATAQLYDVLIRNARVLDGTGNDWFRADIAITGDRIERIGRLPDATAHRTIDATGMYVAPGFIDLHSHADRAMTSEHLEARRAKSLNSQGLTTIIGGADGRNTAWPVTAEISALQDQGHAMNFVPMVGHSTVRLQVMGNDYERAATPAEIARMQELVRSGMDAGAWGLGAGVEYRPARYSDPEELVALAKAVAPYDGFYIAHQRSEASMPLWQLPSNVDDWPVDGLQALEETINIAREAGIRVVASHHKARGRSSFGRSGHDTLVVNAARAEGLEVYLDVYPYETFGGGARPMIPKWSLVHDTVNTSGGRDSPVYNRPGIYDDARAHLERRWNDPATRERIARDIAWIVDHNGGADRVVVLRYPDESFVGKTLAELAAERGGTFQDVVVHMALNGYPDMVGGARTRGYGIHDVDVVNYYRQEYTATASDAGVSGVEGTPFASVAGAHPRHFGAFTRKIAHYVKDLKAISLPFAVRSMTGLPARIIGLEDRGLVREGYKADLVIFDLERLRDRATVLEPDRFSEGVDYVMVNGVLTVDGGEFTDELPGVVVGRGGRGVS